MHTKRNCEPGPKLTIGYLPTGPGTPPESTCFERRTIQRESLRRGYSQASAYCTEIRK
jgi:hypothetical protein